jgi:enoyl-CoA hydratase/carnithine racemase
MVCVSTPSPRFAGVSRQNHSNTYVLFAGLVSAVFPVDKLLEHALKTAEKIAGLSKLSTGIAKEAINSGKETLRIFQCTEINNSYVLHILLLP